MNWHVIWSCTDHSSSILLFRFSDLMNSCHFSSLFSRILEFNSNNEPMNIFQDLSFHTFLTSRSSQVISIFLHCIDFVSIFNIWSINWRTCLWLECHAAMKLSRRYVVDWSFLLFWPSKSVPCWCSWYISCWSRSLNNKKDQRKLFLSIAWRSLAWTSLPNSAFSDPTVALARLTFEHSIEFSEIRSWTQNSRKEINQFGIDSERTWLVDKHAIIPSRGNTQRSISEWFYRDGTTRSGLLVRIATWTGLVSAHQFGFDSPHWHWSFSSTTVVRS